MKFPFFASFIIFILWLSFMLSRNRRRTDKNVESYWEKENRANSTRRKSLEDLPYVVIPFETLPVHILPKDETIADCLETLNSLKDSPIVNFTGISNTDLKLAYGAPNIDLLMQYDQRYTVLARTLQQWAARLYELGFMEEALTVLEYALSTNTDVSGSYRLLLKIYKSNGQPEKIEALKQQAQKLSFASQESVASQGSVASRESVASQGSVTSRSIILRILNESDP